MQQLQIIGNLGEDVAVREYNGRKFATFRVACSEKVRVDDRLEERTTWYSCSTNNADAGVINFLKKGTTVFVQGRPVYQLYDSAAHHCKMIDIRIFCDTIQLCGAKREEAKQSEDDSAAPF